MEKITLKVEDYTPVRRKEDKTIVAGLGNNGIPWQLYKVNKKYSYFFHGEGKPDFVLGETYPFDMETKQEGLYTNYQIFRPKQDPIPIIEEPMVPKKEATETESTLGELKLIKIDAAKLHNHINQLIKNLEK